MSTRQGTRINISLCLEVIQTARHSLGGDLESALIFAAILAGNAEQLDESPALARQYAGGPVPDDLRRPMRVQRLSESLALARETTRSKAAALVAAGLVEQTENGLIVPASTLASLPMVSLVVNMMGALDNSLKLAALAGEAGLRPGERLAPRPFPTMWGAMRALTQHVLRGVVDLRGYVPPMSLLQAFLLLAILDRSAHSLDDVRPAADQCDPPLGRALQLVTAQGLAQFVDLPRETVRRNMQRLVQLDVLAQVPDGYAISPTVRRAGLRSEGQLQESSKANLARLVRRLRNIDALVIPSAA